MTQKRKKIAFSQQNISTDRAFAISSQEKISMYSKRKFYFFTILFMVAKKKKAKKAVKKTKKAAGKKKM